MSRRCVQEGRVGTVTARCAILLALTLAVPQTLRAAPGDLAPGAVDPTFGISITPIGSGKAATHSSSFDRGMNEGFSLDCQPRLRPQGRRV